MIIFNCTHAHARGYTLVYIITVTRGVHQTTQIAPKPPVKWHNNTAPQVTVHHTPWCSAVCGFIIRKLHRTSPSLYINIFIFNVKYIVKL